MNSRKSLSYAVIAILSAAAATSARAEAPAADSSAGLEEIVVTAQRRTENMQDVPITIQALTGETLHKLNVTTFDDYVKYLPNVTSAGAGPGQNQIYMRGLATTQDGGQSSGATQSFPNVAVYLDDQSTQMPGRNLDIYAADLERIEVLEGPQGTLFGAGAQAGVIRYITNKPKLNVTEANVNAGYAVTAHGDPSTNGDFTLNLPLITDKLAARVVVYNEKRGGYINNVPGTFTRSNSDVGIGYLFCNDGNHPYYSTCVRNGRITPTSNATVPPVNQSVNNNSLAANAINPVTYQGIRAGLYYQINDDWNALITQSYQNMEADGVFAETVVTSSGQSLPDLSTQLYNQAYNKDKFESTAWTLNGRIGALKAVYTGSFLLRNIEQVGDYTNYTRGQYADYYQCKLRASAYYHASTNGGGACYSPSSTWRTIQRNTHQSHEFRLSTPDDWRMRAIGGLYWEQYKLQDQSDWFYKTAEAGFAPLQPDPTATLNNPGVRPSTDAFYDDVTRGYNQKAMFGSVDFDLIPKTLTFTAGTRYYRMDTYEVGAKQGSYHCRPNGLYAYRGAADGSVCQGGLNLDTLNITDLLGLPHEPNNVYAPDLVDTANGLHKLYSGFKSRLNLSWKVTPDALVYGTWSQGLRPGGYNRGTGVTAGTSSLAGIFSAPIGYKPDELTNEEIGWKTQWLDHRLQFNGALYYEDWKDAQVGIFAPGVTGNLTFTTNGPEYHVKGMETELIARVTRALTIQGSASWNHSELVSIPSVINIKTGQPIDFSSLGIGSIFGKVGDPLANSPPFQGNLRARYEFSFGGYDAFWQLGGTRRAHSYASTNKLSKDLQGNSIAYDQAAFSTLDGSLGIAKDAWSVQVYGENLTDTRADLFSSNSNYVKEQTVNRPRTLGLRFGYKFSDK